MLIKLFIVFMLVLIIGSLFSALLFLYRDHGDSERVVKALTARIALSIALFIFLMGAFYFGLIPPQH